MTPDEAKKISAEWDATQSTTTGPALRFLLDALRSAEGQVVEMREAAAKVAEDVAAQWSGVRDRDVGDCMTGIAKAIRFMPAPAARTDSPARTYEDGVRDAAKAVSHTSAMPLHSSTKPAFDVALEMRRWCRDNVEALLAPAPATDGATRAKGFV